MLRLASGEHDATQRYALLRESFDAAVAGDDVVAARAAIDRLVQTFDVPPAVLPLKLLEHYRDRRAERAQRRELATLAAELVETEARAERFETALQAAELGGLFAAQSGQRDLVRQLRERGGVLLDLQDAQAEAKALEGELAQRRDNPDASMALGRLYCFRLGRWDDGIPLIASGPEGDARRAARAELARPETPATQADLGDRWWALATAEAEPIRTRVRERACLWYERARRADDGEAPQRRRDIKSRLAATPTFKKQLLPTTRTPVPGVAATGASRPSTGLASRPGPSVSFVLDASGSMIQVLPRAREDIRQAIGRLGSSESFVILICADDRARSFADGVALPATPANRRKAADWLTKLTTSGTSDPTPGIRAALALRPGRVVFYSDGNFAYFPSLDAARRLNDARVPIDTVWTPYPDEIPNHAEEPVNELVMTQLAREHGGTFRTLSTE